MYSLAENNLIKNLYLLAAVGCLIYFAAKIAEIIVPSISGHGGLGYVIIAGLLLLSIGLWGLYLDGKNIYAIVASIMIYIYIAYEFLAKPFLVFVEPVVALTANALIALIMLLHTGAAYWSSRDMFARFATLAAIAAIGYGLMLLVISELSLLVPSDLWIPMARLLSGVLVGLMGFAYFMRATGVIGTDE